MNEDESTLSLSDKVLDRANALRFGRPEELVSTSESGVSQIGNDGQLPYGNWREWVSDPLDAGSEWGTKLHQLNKDLMERKNHSATVCSGDIGLYSQLSG